MKNNIAEYYADDHDQLDGYFKKYQELKHSDYKEAKENFRNFKFGLQRHILWEEEILFPLFEQKTGVSEGGPTHVMKMEHRQIEQALEAIHQKVKKADLDTESEEQALLSLLGPHNTKEENVVYPVTEQLSTDEDRESLFNKMEQVPPERYQSCGCHKQA